MKHAPRREKRGEGGASGSGLLHLQMRIHKESGGLKMSMRYWLRSTIISCSILWEWALQQLEVLYAV